MPAPVLRGRAYMGQRYRVVLADTGFICLLVAGLMLTPLTTLIFWPLEWRQIGAFGVPAIVLGLSGLVIWRCFRKRSVPQANFQEAAVIVFLSWTTAGVAAGMPFMLGANLNFTQAVFESVSGWTTTGLSLVDVTKASHPILLWRSTLQLVGGAGLAIMMLAALMGPGSATVSAAEGRSDYQLAPHVRQSARLVVILYSGYAVAGIIGLWLAGMTLFDAINHSFAAVATGGFSTKPQGIAHWDSIAIESVIIPLMIAGSLNFATAWLIVRGKWKAVFQNGEIRTLATVLPTAILLLFILTSWSLYPSLGKGIRVAVFETTSAITGTGFSSTTYRGWNSIGLFIITAAMLIGGGACSTSGGIKQIRIYIIYRSLRWEIQRLLSPRSAVTPHCIWEKEHQTIISDSRVCSMAAYTYLYLIAWLAGAGILAAHGHSFDKALFEYASALGTVGLSVGITLPDSPSLLIWTETVGMFLGRLEFFVVFVGASKLVRDAAAFARSR